MYNENYFTVTEEMFASWLDGTFSPEEEDRFMTMCSSDPDMQEIMEANDQINETFEDMVEDGYELPDEMLSDFELPGIDNEVQVYHYCDSDDFYSDDEESFSDNSQHTDGSEDSNGQEMTDFGDFV